MKISRILASFSALAVVAAMAIPASAGNGAAIGYPERRSQPASATAQSPLRTAAALLRYSTAWSFLRRFRPRWQLCCLG